MANRQALPIPPEWEEIRRQHREEAINVAAPVTDDRGDTESVHRLPSRTYVNISRRKFHGVGYGESVDLALTDDQHEALMASGVVELGLKDEVPPEDDDSRVEDVTADDSAVVVKQEAGEEITADEHNEGEQA